MCVVLMKSIVETPDLHMYVETKNKSERDVTLAILGFESII